MNFTPNLDAYFARIAYGGATEPTRKTLDAIAFAHVRAIPFENLDVLLGRGIDLDPIAVERKLVHARRGGYCFEQNAHLLHVLRSLGYAVTPLAARVRLQQARAFTPARTHMVLRVDVAGERWLVDVGVGGMSPTCALSLDARHEQQTPHEPRRIIAEGARAEGDAGSPAAPLFHQVRLGDTWHDVYEFTLEEMPEIDREVGNWYTSTHPRSHFRSRLTVARATETGRVTMLNRELTFRDRSGSAEVHVVQSEEELRLVLAREFGLQFDEGTHFDCAGLDWPAS